MHAPVNRCCTTAVLSMMDLTQQYNPIKGFIMVLIFSSETRGTLNLPKPAPCTDLLKERFKI